MVFPTASVRLTSSAASSAFFGLFGLDLFGLFGPGLFGRPLRPSSAYSEQQTSPSLALRLTNYTWAQDPAGNSYIRQIQNISDPGQSYSVTKQVGQTLDQYGNVTQTLLYSFSNLSTPAKTYTNTYWSSGASPAAGAPIYAYILNRLLTSTATDGTNNFTLVSNVYDQYPARNGLFGAPFATQHDNSYAYTNTGYPYTPRGNVTGATPLGSPTVTYSYDITGTVLGTSGAFGGPTSVTTGTATNYAAPTAVTTGNALTTSLSWNSFLATTQSTGPNGDSATTAYDPTTARPTSTTSPYGATITYAYSNTRSAGYGDHSMPGAHSSPGQVLTTTVLAACTG